MVLPDQFYGISRQYEYGINKKLVSKLLSEPPINLVSLMIQKLSLNQTQVVHNPQIKPRLST